MCDHGRLQGFLHVNAGDRVKAPLVKKEAGLVEVGWDEALAGVASQLKAFRKSEVAVVASPQLTNEDAFLVRRFARDVVGTKHLAFHPHLVEDDQDEFLIRADKSPNSRGLQELGIESAKAVAGIVQGIRDGAIRALVVAEENLAALPEVQSLLGRLEYLVVCASNESETTAIADVVLPASTFAEKNGTFTNFQGHVQRIRPSLATLDRERSLDGFAMSRLDKFGSQFDRWAKGTKRDARPTWRIIAGIASAMGSKARYNSSEEVFNDLVSSVAGFKGMTYRRLGNRGQKVKVTEPVRSTT
jgi:NADH-quinone oxidoreductase subunit G